MIMVDKLQSAFEFDGNKYWIELGSDTGTVYHTIYSIVT